MNRSPSMLSVPPRTLSPACRSATLSPVKMFIHERQAALDAAVGRNAFTGEHAEDVAGGDIGERNRFFNAPRTRRTVSGIRRAEAVEGVVGGVYRSLPTSGRA